MNTEHFKTTSEENIAKKNDAIQMTNTYLANLAEYKNRLINIMKATKDKNELDDYLDVYSALDKTMKKMASIYAIYAVMFDIKENDPNSLNDNVVIENIKNKLNNVDYIKDEIKQFINDSSLINVMLSQDFDKDKFLYELFRTLQNIIINKLKI